MEATALTNLQLELLKIFSREIPSSDLLELKIFFPNSSPKSLSNLLTKHGKNKAGTKKNAGIIENSSKDSLQKK